MKLMTIKGEWFLFDGEREITVNEGAVAFGYAMIMAELRPHKCTTPSIHPVRSLVPHPKKRRVTKEWREKISQIKSRIAAQNI